MYLGDFAEDSVHYFPWGTNDANGASITRATDGTLTVYKDDNTSGSTAGVTDNEDFATKTGVHLCKLDLSADAFYAPGHDYSVILVGAVIDGKNVNCPIASFSIENRTTAPIKTVVDGINAKTTNLPADPADDSDIDAQLAAINTLVTAVKTLTDKLATGMIELDGVVYRFTANALEQAPAGGGGSGMPTLGE